MAKKTPALAHCWKRSWAVEPGQYLVASRAFHWQPVRRTKRMASMQTRSGVGGRPPPKRWVLTRLGMRRAMTSQRSSESRQVSGMGRSSMRVPENRAQLQTNEMQLHQGFIGFLGLSG